MYAWRRSARSMKSRCRATSFVGKPNRESTDIPHRNIPPSASSPFRDIPTKDNSMLRRRAQAGVGRCHWKTSRNRFAAARLEANGAVELSHVPGQSGNTTYDPGADGRVGATRRWAAAVATLFSASVGRKTTVAATAVIRTIQELLGHSYVKTTMIYTHVLNRGPSGVRSPVDQLCGNPGREVVMPIRTTCCDKETASMQHADESRAMAGRRPTPMASYAGRKLNLRILCGSV